MSKEFTQRPATVTQFMNGFMAAAPVQQVSAGNDTVRRPAAAAPVTPVGNYDTRRIPSGYAQQGFNNPSQAYQQKQKNKSKRGLIIALSALTTILVLGLATWGFLALTGSHGGKSGKGGKKNSEESLQYAIDNDDFDLLLEYAEMDSARAYYPLAKIYEDKEDFDKAKKWAKKALYSTELSDSEQRKANKLVEKLNNVSESKDYYQSIETDEEYYSDTSEPAAAE